MIQHQTKQDLITASLVDLMNQNKSFRSITVQNIASNCGISRRTFYNCFRDKYDIIMNLYKNTCAAIASDGIEGIHVCILTSCRNKEHQKQFWKEILKDEICRDYLELLCYELQCQYIEQTQTLNKYQKALLRLYAFGAFRTETDWLLNNCPVTSEQMAAVLFNSLPSEIKSLYTS